MKTMMDWVITGKILHARFPVEFDIQEWNEAGERINQFFDQANASVHIITDMLVTEKHPMNAMEIIRGASWLRHPRLGWAIHLTNSKVQKLLAMITIQRYMARYRVFESPIAAMEFLKDMDDSLNI